MKDNDIIEEAIRLGREGVNVTLPVHEIGVGSKFSEWRHQKLAVLQSYRLQFIYEPQIVTEQK